MLSPLPICGFIPQVPTVFPGLYCMNISLEEVGTIQDSSWKALPGNSSVMVIRGTTKWQMCCSSVAVHIPEESSLKHFLLKRKKHQASRYKFTGSNQGT